MLEYQNGGFFVRIHDDGTKVRTPSSIDPMPEYPESIDVKVTNDCDAGCAYCHEESVPGGASFDVDEAYRLFVGVPVPMELAIGGGNPLTRKRDLNWLNRMLLNRRPYAMRHVINVTVNSRHLKGMKSYEDVPNCTAMGISYMRGLHDEMVTFTRDGMGRTLNPVIHVIAGVQTVEDVNRCVDDFDRVLVLGFKKWGRGASFNAPTVDSAVQKMRDAIGSVIERAAHAAKVIAFDNLAVRQLGVERFFTDENWKKVYMGDDGQFSMYLDLVRMEYAKSSFATERFPIGGKTVKEMFQHVRTL